MIERGEWVRCDAALSLPGRPAVQMAAQGDVRNLRRCEQLYAFLTHRRQQDWAAARTRGWATIADPRYPGAVRNVCPRHAHTPPTVLVLMPLRPANRVHTEDVALALVDAAQAGQALAAELEQRLQLEQRGVSAEDLAEMYERQRRHEALRQQMEQRP